MGLIQNIRDLTVAIANELNLVRSDLNTKIESLQQGSNIIIDDTDPLNPIISSTASGTGSGGDPFLTITLNDFSDTNYLYYGGMDQNSDWKINRYDKTNLTTKNQASNAINPSFTNLTDAWNSRGSLSYQ